jgi:UDP-N-acetylmuramoylalanine--D-glutamate ligase
MKTSEAFDLRVTFPRRVGILGAGRSGLAAATYFRSKGVDIFISDSCAIEKLEAILSVQGLASAAHEGGGHTAALLQNDLIVISPGVRSDLPILLQARMRGIPVWSELELGFRASEATFLAVTGSTGKSTTVSLLGEALKAGGKETAVAGNIGIPLVGITAGLSRDAWVAAEVSSFQLEGIDRFRPKAGAVLNFLRNHLDRYRSENDYYAAKKRIAENFTKDNYLVLNIHDVKLAAWADTMNKRTSVIFFGSMPGAGDSFWYDEGAGTIRYRFGGEQGTILDVSDMLVKGRHNFENAAAASALARIAGIGDAAIGRGFAGFKGLSHRLEFSGEVAGVRYYNDSKSTTAESVLCAVTAFAARVHLIAGGRDKGCDFSLIKQALGNRISDVCLIGEAADRMQGEWQGIVPIYRCDTLDEAVMTAARHGLPGDVVVFSPGCSSFDMFADYEDRGNRFKAIVASLSAERIVR